MISSLAARSNSISQRVMKPLAVDVFTAAGERIRRVYEAYDVVVVSYSGGKDSTCVLELTIQVARELGKLPVDVLFFDEEVLLPETEAMVVRTRERPAINLKWVCGQVGYWDASSNEQPHWITWDPAKRDVWVREPPPPAPPSPPEVQRVPLPGEVRPPVAGRIPRVEVSPRDLQAGQRGTVRVTYESTGRTPHAFSVVAWARPGGSWGSSGRTWESTPRPPSWRRGSWPSTAA